MKRTLAIALALVLALTLAACGGNSGGSSTTPPANSGNSSTPPADNTPSNNGGGTAKEWQDSFAKTSGISNLPIPSNCEVDTGKTNSSKVTFTAKAEVTEDEFKAYAEQVFDIVKSASPDGNYNLSDTYTKGDAYGSFGDVPSSSKMAYWYYTSNGYVKQISIDGKGSTLVVKTNDVYNQAQERVKP